jgi:glycosyltransferase involved in cell wall biosynthesis
MGQQKSDKVAWLLPAMGTGGISFQHILKEFSKTFPNTVTFTGQWPGYAPSFEDSFIVQEVGATRYIKFSKSVNGYSLGFSYASPQIIRHLLQFRAKVIFANAFTAWTMMALLLKPIGNWKVIITYEGGSSTYEGTSATLRYRIRLFMAKLADAFVVNSQTGKAYLTNTLKVDSERIFYQPFLVPSLDALLHYSELETPRFDQNLKRPVFLFVGQIIPRKGIKNLLKACLMLKDKGYANYSLMIVGDGEQRQELQTFAKKAGIEDQVEWMGKIPYRFLGEYFKFADVFIFPTYDDIWGMVLTEAMAFGKPVICSTGAGATEMIEESENGFVYDFNDVNQLSTYMQSFIDNPQMIHKMGAKSLHIMQNHSPAQATQAFFEAVDLVTQK